MKQKHNKWVVSAASAALVASAIVPVASAASFSDIESSDHKDAILALADANIVGGYPDGTFKPNAVVTRGNVTKFLGKWLVSEGYEIPTDYKTEARFTDLPTTTPDQELLQYAALVKDAGVFKGSNNKLMYTNNMNREQMAVVLVRAINTVYNVDLVADYKESDFKSAITDLDKATATENREAIIALEYAGLTNVKAFNPKNSLTRGQFASFLHRTITNIAEAALSVKEAKAVDATTLEVTLSDDTKHTVKLDTPLEENKATKVEFEIEGNTYSAVVTYEVTEVKVESVKAIDVNKVEVKFNKAVDSAVVKVALKKGNAIQYTTATFADDKKSVVLEAPSAIKAGDYEVVVTGLGEAEVKEAIKIEAAVEAAITINNTELVKDSAKVNFKVTNQYGTDMDVASNAAGFDIQAYNVTQKADVTVTTSSKSNFALALNSAKIGDEVRVIVTYKGITTTKTLKVVESGNVVDVELGLAQLPTNAKRFTVGDAAIKLPYTLKDQYGKEVKLSASKTGATAIAAADGVTFLTSDSEIVDPATIATDANGVLTFTAGSKAGTVTITAIINSTGDVATTTLKVEDAPKVNTVAVSAPTKLIAANETVDLDLVVTDQFGEVIKNDDAKVQALTLVKDANTASVKIVNGKLQIVAGANAGSTTVTIKDAANSKELAKVTFNIEAAAVATAVTAIDVAELYENNATDKITFEDIKVKDQYGRDYSLKAGDALTVSHKDTTADNVTFGIDGDADSDLEAGETLTFTGTTATNNEVIEFALANGAKFDLTLASVASKDITSFEIKTVPTIFAQGKTVNVKYNVDLELVGKSGGKVVALATNKITNATSSNTNIASVTTKTGEVTVTGLSKGASTIAVWEGATKLAETNVNVSDVAPVSTTVKFRNTADLKVAVNGKVNASTSLEVLDQYGVALAKDGYFTSSNPTVATVDSVTGVVTGVVTGETTITYITKNAIVTSTKVVVK